MCESELHFGRGLFRGARGGRRVKKEDTGDEGLTKCRRGIEDFRPHAFLKGFGAITAKGALMKRVLLVHFAV